MNKVDWGQPEKTSAEIEIADGWWNIVYPGRDPNTIDYVSREECLDRVGETSDIYFFETQAYFNIENKTNEKKRVKRVMQGFPSKEAARAYLEEGNGIHTVE